MLIPFHSALQTSDVPLLDDVPMGEQTLDDSSESQETVNLVIDKCFGAFAYKQELAYSYDTLKRHLDLPSSLHKSANKDPMICTC
jgi:hypothetical protein